MAPQWDNIPLQWPNRLPQSFLKKNVFVRCECKIPRISKGWTQLCGNFLFRKHFPSTFFLACHRSHCFLLHAPALCIIFFEPKKKLTKKQGKTRKQSANYIFLPLPFLKHSWSKPCLFWISALCSPYARLPAHGWSLAEGPSSWKFQTLDPTPQLNRMSSMTFTYQKVYNFDTLGVSEDHLNI